MAHLDMTLQTTIMRELTVAAMDSTWKRFSCVLEVVQYTFRVGAAVHVRADVFLLEVTDEVRLAVRGVVTSGAGVFEEFFTVFHLCIILRDKFLSAFWGI